RHQRRAQRTAHHHHRKRHRSEPTVHPELRRLQGVRPEGSAGCGTGRGELHVVADCAPSAGANNHLERRTSTDAAGHEEPRAGRGNHPHPLERSPGMNHPAIRQRSRPWLLSAPTIGTVIVFTVIPLLYTAALSVSGSTLGQPFRDWVGFSNFAKAL